jgi:arsenate reductase (glutaredoxin)
MIQVIGTKKCRGTQKAIRFFRERGVQHQFVDLNQRSLGDRELENITNGLTVEAGVDRWEHLLDTESAAYRKRGLSYQVFDVKEEVLQDQSLLRTPIVRSGSKSAVGVDEAAWERLAVE